MVAQALDRREETNGGESTSARILEYYRYSAYGSVTVLPAHDDGAAKSLVDTGGGTGVYHASDDDMGSGSRKAWDRVEDTPLDLADNNTIMLLRREADGTYSHLSARADYGRVSQFGNTFTFTARRQDAHTGLMYYRYRMYEPVTGRFVGKDPLIIRAGSQSLGQSSNPTILSQYNAFGNSDLWEYTNYTYGLNVPTVFGDPTGENPAVIAGCLVGAGFAGAYASWTCYWRYSGWSYVACIGCAALNGCITGALASLGGKNPLTDCIRGALAGLVDCLCEAFLVGKVSSASGLLKTCVMSALGNCAVVMGAGNAQRNIQQAGTPTTKRAAKAAAASGLAGPTHEAIDSILAAIEEAINKFVK